MKFKLLCVSTVLFLITGLSGISAQSVDPADIVLKSAPETKHICTFEPTDINSKHFVRHFDVAGKERSSQQSSEFNVTYRNQCNGEVWPNEAVEAFEHAMNIWESHLQSNIPVRIQAIWQKLDANVLGSAGPTLIAQIDPVGEPDTWYSVAQASAMISDDIVGNSEDTDFDVVININCEFSDWYFGQDANPPQNQIDFITVVLHEIGHGIGFIGSMRADEEIPIAEWGFNGSGGQNFPIVYDTFVEDGMSTSILNETVYPNESEVLYDAVTGDFDGLFFNGVDANVVNFGTPVRLYAPFPWQGGSSYSHVDQDSFGNSDNALMRPRIDRQSAIHTPGPVMCGMLSDMGWPLGASCLELIGVESSIAVDRSFLDFGVSNVGDRETQTLIVSNDASAQDPLSARIVLDNPNYTFPEGRATFTVDPGGSINIPIRYVPSEVDVHTPELLLFHNSANQPNPLRISLQGEALQEGRFFVIDQNFPNPFNSQTRIEYALTGPSDVRLDLYNTSGQHISTLVDGPREEGRHEIDFNPSGLASGVYLYRIIVDGSRVDTKKLMYVK